MGGTTREPHFAVNGWLVMTARKLTFGRAGRSRYWVSVVPSPRMGVPTLVQAERSGEVCT